MPQVISCPKCPMRMQVPDDATGKQVKCPSCQNVFVIGAASAPQPVGAGVGAAASSGASGSTPRQAAASAPAPAPAAKGAPTKCPACGSDLLPGAVACMDCGYLIQSETASQEMEGPPNLCPNPACGVANPPGEKNCVRCSTALPIGSGTLLHNRYRIEKLLAMGGFGAVYLATDTKGGNSQVAIKEMICADQQEFPIRLNFFRREAEILRALSSIPVVTRFHDLIEQGQSAYLVLEFIKGQDLLKIMEGKNNQPFPLEQVLDWGRQICDVLEAMHTQQPPLIHRDLKPDNIMLLPDGKTIKMIDFGTARDLGRSAKEKMAVKTKVYTEGYAPPEQIIGRPEPRSDLFALVGTLYHLVTGKAPEGYHTANDIDAQLGAGGNGIPPQHRWFYELVKINLAEDINARYFTAKELKGDLEKKQVTHEVPCPKCRTTNKVREPYCSKCAEPLTEPTAPCYHCGKTNRMGSRCCIYCGNRLR